MRYALYRQQLIGVQMPANLQLIKQRLFDCAREEIARDYRFNLPPTPEELSKLVLRSLDQKACENPLNQACDNNCIFRAVVRSLGSNNRKWAIFLNNQRQIARLLSDFGLEDVRRNSPNCLDLATLLPGQTATADARAILKWADLLSENKNYYQRIVQASGEMHRRFEQKHGGGQMPTHLLFLCVVAHFTDSTRGAQSRKWPGMGFVLGSEFLRNLRWNGFKPDRHIKRLLARWTNDQVNVRAPINELRCTIPRIDKPLWDNLRWSLVGMEITPQDLTANFSQFDNLIWLLGAYVERKNRESRYNYMLPGHRVA
jgi:hypothetical protein